MRCFVRALISELVTDCCACFCCVCASGWEGLGWWGVNMAVCRWGEVLSGSALEPIRLKPSVHWGCWEKKKACCLQCQTATLTQAREEEQDRQRADKQRSFIQTGRQPKTQTVLHWIWKSGRECTRTPLPSTMECYLCHCYQSWRSIDICVYMPFFLRVAVG